MNPGADILGTAIGNLLSNALTEASRYVALRGEKQVHKGVAQTARQLQGDVLVVKDATINALFDSFGDNCPQELLDLLLSPDLEELTRLWIAARKLGYPTSGLRNILTRLAAQILPDVCVEPAGRIIAAAIEDGLGRALASDAGQGLLDLDPSLVGTAILSKQLESLPTMEAFWLAHSREQEDRLRSLMKRHRAAMRRYTSKVEPPDFSERRQVPLNQIYVPPTLTGFLNTFGGLCDHVANRRPGGLVVLGDPGAGKTTLSRYIANQLTTRDEQGVQTVTIVALRDFEERRKGASMSVADYLSHHEKSQLQISAKASTWEKALRRGSVAVIFDGLDELLVVSRRVEMADVIEGFLSEYPTVPIVVTCRAQGYSEAALSVELFRTIRIQPFSSDQVADYVTRWYSLPGNSIPHRSGKDSAALFLEESEGVSEIRTNPLLLSLLCLLFRGRGYIPENMGEIYQACSELLFEQWDRYRQVRVARYGDRLRRLLDRLAFWMYQERLNELGVTETQLLARATKEILELKAADEDQARSTAEEFITHCKGRAWVFSDSGKSDTKARRFCFAHRSFLEYFTARYIADMLRQPRGWSKCEAFVLEPGNSFVVLLALQILGVEADKIVLNLIARACKLDSEGLEAVTALIPQVIIDVDLHESILAEAVDLILNTVIVDPEDPLASAPYEFWCNPASFDEIASPAEIVYRLTECRNDNWHGISKGIVRAMDSVAPDSMIKPWEMGKYVVFCVASSSEKVSRQPAHLSEMKALVDGRTRSLANSILIRPRFSESIVAIVCLDIIEKGVLANRWGADLLAVSLSGQSTPLGCVAVAMLGTRQWDDSCSVSFRLLDEVAHSVHGIEIDRVWVIELLEGLRYDLDPEVDVCTLESEDFHFDTIPVRERLCAIALLYGLAKASDHDLRGTFAYVLHRGLYGEVMSLLDADSRGFDPLMGDAVGWWLSEDSSGPPTTTMLAALRDCVNKFKVVSPG